MSCKRSINAPNCSGHTWSGRQCPATRRRQQWKSVLWQLARSGSAGRLAATSVLVIRCEQRQSARRRFHAAPLPATATTTKGGGEQTAQAAVDSGPQGAAERARREMHALAQHAFPPHPCAAPAAPPPPPPPPEIAHIKRPPLSSASHTSCASRRQCDSPRICHYSTETPVPPPRMLGESDTQRQAWLSGSSLWRS